MALREYMLNFGRVTPLGYSSLTDFFPRMLVGQTRAADHGVRDSGQFFTKCALRPQLVQFNQEHHETDGGVLYSCRNLVAPSSVHIIQGAREPAARCGKVLGPVLKNNNLHPIPCLGGAVVCFGYCERYTCLVPVNT
jgi:hypothetical protein